MGMVDIEKKISTMEQNVNGMSFKTTVKTIFHFSWKFCIHKTTKSTLTAKYYNGKKDQHKEAMETMVKYKCGEHGKQWKKIWNSNGKKCAYNVGRNRKRLWGLKSKLTIYQVQRIFLKLRA